MAKQVRIYTDLSQVDNSIQFAEQEVHWPFHSGTIPGLLSWPLRQAGSFVIGGVPAGRV